MTDNGKAPMTDAELAARLFHETYERLAPEYGYETRADTKAFDPNSPNGRLMIAVCGHVEARLLAKVQRLRQEIQQYKDIKRCVGEGFDRALLLKYESLESELCPDVGFEEYIKTLEKKIALYEPPEPRDETLVCVKCGDDFNSANVGPYADGKFWCQWCKVELITTEKWKRDAAQKLMEGK